MNLTQLQTHDARNAQIVSLLISGFMPKQIAIQTGQTEDAVRSRLKRIRRKEGVDSNIALVGKILEARWANQSKSRKAHGGEAA